MPTTKQFSPGCSAALASVVAGTLGAWIGGLVGLQHLARSEEDWVRFGHVLAYGVMGGGIGFVLGIVATLVLLRTSREEVDDEPPEGR